MPLPPWHLADAVMRAHSRAGYLGQEQALPALLSTQTCLCSASSCSSAAGVQVAHCAMVRSV